MIYRCVAPVGVLPREGVIARVFEHCEDSSICSVNERTSEIWNEQKSFASKVDRKRKNIVLSNEQSSRKSLKFPESERSEGSVKKRISWSEPLENCVEIPGRKSLNVSELWHHSSSYGREAILARNDKDELREYSELMLSLEWLSPENRAKWTYEALLNEADELSKPVMVDQSLQSFEGAEGDLGLNLDDEF